MVNAAPFSHFVSLSSEFDITLEARYRGGLDECSNAEKQVKVVDSSKSPAIFGPIGAGQVRSKPQKTASKTRDLFRFIARFGGIEATTPVIG